MTRRQHPLSMPAVLLLASGLILPFAPPLARAQGSGEVNVYEYAVNHPVDDSPLSLAPTLGETVPPSIDLIPLDGNASYAYFYYNGQPVIVDLTTRSVVRVGQ